MSFIFKLFCLPFYEIFWFFRAFKIFGKKPYDWKILKLAPSLCVSHISVKAVRKIEYICWVTCSGGYTKVYAVYP